MIAVMELALGGDREKERVRETTEDQKMRTHLEGPSRETISAQRPLLLNYNFSTVAFLGQVTNEAWPFY